MDHLRSLDGYALQVRPDVLYPGLEMATKALDWLSARSVVVLGFDGFRTDGQSLYPDLEHIADFSRDLQPADWDQTVAASIEKSRDVLSKWRGTVEFVDFVVASKEEMEGLGARAPG